MNRSRDPGAAFPKSIAAAWHTSSFKTTAFTTSTTTLSRQRIRSISTATRFSSHAWDIKVAVYFLVGGQAYSALTSRLTFEIHDVVLAA